MNTIMKDKYRKETNKDVYPSSDFGSDEHSDYTNDYVYWLEDQLTTQPPAPKLYKSVYDEDGETYDWFYKQVKKHGFKKELRWDVVISLLRQYKSYNPAEPRTAKMMEQYASQQGDGWVSVEDRLPEFTRKHKIGNKQIHLSDWVLVWFGEKFPTVSRYRKTSSGGYYWEEMNNANITHWRELPEPPKSNE